MDESGAGCIDPQIEAITLPFREECVRLRARVAELEAERDRLVREHMDCTALRERDDARAERAKWERAARRLAARLSLVRGMPDEGLSEEEWISYATDAPQAQEEEKP